MIAPRQKLDVLVEELAAIAQGAVDDVTEPSEESDRRKVIVFSYFADTVAWVNQFLERALKKDKRLAAYKGRLIAVTGNDSEAHQRDALFGFAPRTTESPETR